MDSMVFVDATAWIAIASPKDENHEPASEYIQEAADSGILLFTTRFIFAETLIFIRKRVSVEKAIEFGEYLLESPQVKMLEIQPELHEKTWEIFKKYRDWRDLSYVDCLSFVVMKNSGINTAFAFDDDFRRFGFVKVP
jgi:predicted nucleic acid-binding protein